MSFDIQNRRYTGSKNKIIDWIKKNIIRDCKGADSFCDLFAGTGVVTNAFIDRFDSFIINDFLYSNEIIYKAFFLNVNFDKEKIKKYCLKFNKLNPSLLKPNYVSENYGNKFFEYNDSLKIGEIREIIEEEKEKINLKEYCILLASLIYSLDRCANTVGHYDAYFRNKKLISTFKFELITPINFKEDNKKKISIYRNDANELSKIISSDIVYIDPPYSSRQYSRFYHVLENIVEWKKPKLYGVAMKPKPENMSEYCISKAVYAFSDLIKNLKCKYIVVSYNNTYNSKSSSSKNKMKLSEIEQILSAKGKTSIHKKEYKPFNSGKTQIRNHKEILFITKVGENND